MKKCPTCNKTFEDSMRFCQTDGTPLVDDAPEFDPYATIMARPGDIKPPAPEENAAVDELPASPAEPTSTESAVPAAVHSEQVLEPLAEPVSEPAAEPIAPPDNILDLPERADPLKTMYVSEAEMQAAFGTVGGENKAEEPVQPEPPSFGGPEAPPPSFGDVAPPPSPFSASEPASQPEPQAPGFDEAPTMFQPSPGTPFEPPPPAPVEQWTPPPAPDASWQNKEIGSNTPFEPPPAGAGGPSQGLAVGSLICGILSCLCCFSVLTGPAAVIMGFVAKKKADEDPSQFTGRGLAMGGIITGILGFLLGVTLIILQVFFGVLGGLMQR